jgi:NAD(P)-dependent dehydrogenase (short-subunit alcohol dehydrogenase family)
MPDPAVTGELEGRVAVVTGASRGIGLATVDALVAAGAIPVLVNRDRAALDAASAYLAERGVEHRADLLDVTDGAAVDRVFGEIARWRGRIDILVNNAGVALRKPTLDLAQDEWQQVIDVNLTGCFLCARAAARTMLPAERGSIVNVASIMGLSGGGLYPNISYQASKGGLVNLTRALAVEWAKAGLRVNAVAPTWVRTDLTRGLFEIPTLFERMLAVTPMRKFPEPADVADAIVFLASDRARMITGHTLPVDGGFLAQ